MAKYVIFHGLRANPGALTVEYGLFRFTKGEITPVGDAAFLQALDDRKEEFSVYDTIEDAVAGQRGPDSSGEGFDDMPGPSDPNQDPAAVAAAALALMDETDRRDFVSRYSGDSVDDLLAPPSAVEEFQRAWDKASDDEKLEIAAIVEALTASEAEGGGNGGDLDSGAAGSAEAGGGAGDAGGEGGDAAVRDAGDDSQPRPARRRRQPAGG